MKLLICLKVIEVPRYVGPAAAHPYFLQRFDPTRSASGFLLPIPASLLSPCCSKPRSSPRGPYCNEKSCRDVHQTTGFYLRSLQSD